MVSKLICLNLKCIISVCLYRYQHDLKQKIIDIYNVYSILSSFSDKFTIFKQSSWFIPFYIYNCSTSEFVNIYIYLLEINS